MSWRLPLWVIAVLSLAACSDGGTGSDQSGASLTSSNPSVQSTSTPTTGQQVTAVAAAKMQVDFDRRMVYLPDQGWLSEDEFWNIYYNEPDKLPGEIDFDALVELGYREPPGVANGGGGS